jgi:hypothetical protein
MEEFIESIQDKIIMQISNEISAKKQLLLEERIKELGLWTEFQRRKNFLFKPIIGVNQDGKEIFFWDDGSCYGRRIITFDIKETYFENDCSNKVTVTLKHY